MRLSAIFYFDCSKGSCNWLRCNEIGICLAVKRDNEGYGAILAILEKQQVTIHPGVIRFQASLDKARVEGSDNYPKSSISVLQPV